jgi:hypothetical protein
LSRLIWDRGTTRGIDGRRLVVLTKGRSVVLTVVRVRFLATDHDVAVDHEDVVAIASKGVVVVPGGPCGLGSTDRGTPGGHGVIREGEE